MDSLVVLVMKNCNNAFIMFKGSLFGSVHLGVFVCMVITVQVVVFVRGGAQTCVYRLYKWWVVRHGNPLSRLHRMQSSGP